ncbi:MAG: hypothetical protein ACPGQL_01185 [Thermoplasmatota archaeon]
MRWLAIVLLIALVPMHVGGDEGQSSSERVDVLPSPIAGQLYAIEENLGNWPAWSKYAVRSAAGVFLLHANGFAAPLGNQEFLFFNASIGAGSFVDL